MSPKRFQPPELCPVCGQPVPANAPACPACGADERAGWDESQTTYDGLDLPEEEFDYEDFVAREFGEGSRTGRPSRFWRVGLIVITLILVWILLSVFV